MTWTKREVETNLVILGDAEGNVRKVGGLLAAITPDRRYPDNRHYELIQQDGSSKTLAGATSINFQLGPADVGKFVKMSFDGWGKGANGRYKIIGIQVFEGEPTPEMQKWPRFSEFNNGRSDPGPTQPVDEEDDDLPF